MGFLANRKVTSTYEVFTITEAMEQGFILPNKIVFGDESNNDLLLITGNYPSYFVYDENTCDYVVKEINNRGELYYFISQNELDSEWVSN